MALKKKSKQSKKVVATKYIYVERDTPRSADTVKLTTTVASPNLSQVQSALNDMDIELSRLGESLGQLLNRLEAVTRVEEAGKATLPQATVNLVPMASRILSQQGRVSSYAELVESLLNRLEV